MFPGFWGGLYLFPNTPPPPPPPPVQKVNSKVLPFKTIKRDVCKLITPLMKTDYLSIYSSNVLF